MPWFSLIADGSRSCDHAPAISGEWAKPLQSGFALLPGLAHSPESRSNPNQDCKETSELELMSNDNYKNKARRPTKNREF